LSGREKKVGSIMPRHICLPILKIWWRSVHHIYISLLGDSYRRRRRWWWWYKV